MDNLMGKFTKATKTITDTSGQLLKTTKLHLALSSEEEKLNSLYMEIGKKVHEIYMYGGSLGSFFDEKYMQIKNVQEKLDNLKKQLDDIKGTKTCPGCGGPADKNAGFCPKCGYKMTGENTAFDRNVEKNIQNDIEIENNHDMIIEENEKSKLGKICPHCGAQNEQEDKFCLSCGRYVS